MERPLQSALLVGSVACAAALAWSIRGPFESPQATSLSNPRRSLSCAAREGAIDLESGAAPEARRQLVAPPAEPGGPRAAPVQPSPELVRVHGRVRRNGWPLDEYDLSFQQIGRGSEEYDWDTTDEDGRYEVELRTGRYDVRNDEEGPSVTSVLISAGQREVVLDIDLPRRD